MVNVVFQTKDLLDRIESYIINSSYKVEYIITELGISKGTYYKKIHEKRFTLDELLKICSIIFPEEYKEEIVYRKLNKALNEVEEGKTYTTEDVFKEFDKIF